MVHSIQGRAGKRRKLVHSVFDCQLQLTTSVMTAFFLLAFGGGGSWVFLFACF